MKNRGITLIEVLIVVALLLGGLVPLVKMIIEGLRGTQIMGSITVANSLAQSLLEEIKQRKWDENAPQKGVYIPTTSASDTLGPDSGENQNYRYTLDDIDDYDDLDDNPIKDESGAVLTEYANKYKRSVVVEYVNVPLGGTVTVETGTKTDYKRVKVTVEIIGENRSVTQSVILANGTFY
ncbi:MAG: hypothetical protein DRI36_05185 [Caldiserica bacterium]|nr:MAG: hypothetical protein DRI36_05185 [Caldisericota bacterium]